MDAKNLQPFICKDLRDVINKEGKGAAFEAFARFEEKPVFIPQFSKQDAKLTDHQLNI